MKKKIKAAHSTLSVTKLNWLYSVWAEMGLVGFKDCRAFPAGIKRCSKCSKGQVGPSARQAAIW